MSSTQHPKIAIIGASISGLTLAISLLKTNAIKPSDIQILETRPAGSKPGGPVALTPNSLRVLDRIGMYDKIRSKGYNYTRMTYRDAEGNFQGDMPWGSKAQWGYDGLRIERAVLLSVLKPEVEALGVQVQHDCSLREVFSESANGVTFRVRKGGKDAGETIEMHAGMLIGCDGVHSKTRTFVLGGQEVLANYVGTMMVAARARSSKLRYTNGFEEAGRGHERAIGVSTSKGTIIMLPSDPEGVDLLFARQFPVPGRNREEWEKMDADKQMLHQMLRNDMDAMPEFAKSILEQAKPEETYVWAIHTLPKLGRWVSAGHKAAIIGDAAHAFIPAAGQGANQALEDAYTIAQVLVADGVSGEMLAKWQKVRMEKVAKVAKLSNQLLNIRLPPAEKEKLPKDELFDLSGTKEEQDARLNWLYGQLPD